MSHTTTLLDVAIRDMDALNKAVAELAARGIRARLVTNTKPRMYSSNQHGVCPYVLRLEDSPYDVGFDVSADGSLTPVFDSWQGHIHKQIGSRRHAGGRVQGAQADIGLLMQTYAKHAAVNAAVAQGYVVENTQFDDQGNIHLTIANVA